MIKLTRPGPGRLPPHRGAGPATRRCGRARASSRTRSRMPSCLDHVAGQLHPARPGPARRTPRRACAALPSVVVVPQGLGAGPAVPDGDGPADLRGHGRVVGDDQHGDAQLGVGGLQRGEHIGAVALSSSPVGSSASSTCGSLASAVAIAARCCSPPDIWSGGRSAQCADASAPSSSAARRRAAAGGHPANRIGRATFCARGQVGQQVPRRLLPDEADHAAPVGQPLPAVIAPRSCPATRTAPAGRRVQPGQDVHQRGLAAAGRAHQRGQLAALRPAGPALAAPAPRCRPPV